MKPAPENHTRLFLPRRTHWFVVGIVTVLAILAAPLITYAQGDYPLPTEVLYVNDYAGVISAEDGVKIYRLFSDLRQDMGIEATVLTINSIHDYDTGDKNIESFATNLFNTWGIGDQEKNNGALILIAVQDRQMRIELGSGYKGAYDTVMQDIIQEQMLPLFKDEQYSQDIYNVARALVNVLTEPAPSSKKQGANLVLIIIAVSGAIIILMIARGVLALLQPWDEKLRYCPRCQSNMKRMRKAFVTNYDVWQCSDCSYSVIQTHSRLHGSKRSAWSTKARHADDDKESSSGDSLGVFDTIAASFLLRRMRQRGQPTLAGVGSAPDKVEAAMTQWAKEEAPVAQFITSYAFGDDLYNPYFGIETAAGNFLGGCGVGLADSIGVGNPKRVTAFDIWLFDTNPPTTVTKVITSEHCYHDNDLRDKLASKGDVVLGYEGGVIILETSSLRIQTKVLEIEDGTEDLPNSFVSRLTLELAVWQIGEGGSGLSLAPA